MATTDLRKLKGWAVAIGTTAVVGYAIFGDHRPNFFTSDEIAHLNAGGEIFAERFRGYDQICLYADDTWPSFKKLGCGSRRHGGLALIRNDRCEAYAIRGLTSEVMGSYDYRCYPWEEGVLIRESDAGYLNITYRLPGRERER